MRLGERVQYRPEFLTEGSGAAKKLRVEQVRELEKLLDNLCDAVELS